MHQGGGSGGGSETGTQYCLWYDYYDENGNFQYSELQFCWVQEES